MSSLNEHLEARLALVTDQGLRRQLREIESPQGPQIQTGGDELINFSSNDYLGLANHPKLKEAAIEAIERFGAGAGASRLICGSLKLFHDLEESLANFKQTEAALTFSTGYAAAVGSIPALIGKDDIVIIDKLVHACIVDAARLAGAKLRVFKHNDLDDLERILKWAEATPPGQSAQPRNVLVVTESVFSMDGDIAPLKKIAELKEKYGAWLMVDEAHATGIFGGRRSGLVEHLGLSGQVEIQMGTLGKTVGAAGGFICGSRKLVDVLINSARSFIFSTAPVPAAAAAAIAGIEFIRSEEGTRRCARLWERVDQSRTGILPVFERTFDRNPTNPAGSPIDAEDACSTPILPLIVGGEAEAVAAADSLRERGFYMPAIRYPTVARGKARLRMTVTADHTAEEIDALREVLTEVINHKS